MNAAQTTIAQTVVTSKASKYLSVYVQAVKARQRKHVEIVTKHVSYIGINIHTCVHTRYISYIYIYICIHIYTYIYIS
jgi:hypothetical protein